MLDCVTSDADSATTLDFWELEQLVEWFALEVPLFHNSAGLEVDIQNFPVFFGFSDLPDCHLPLYLPFL